MSTEKCWSVKLRDIRTIVLRCLKCGAVIGYDPRKWNFVPFSCPNCRTMIEENGPEHNALSHFKEGVESLQKEGRLFEVRLEFNGERE